MSNLTLNQRTKIRASSSDTILKAFIYISIVIVALLCFIPFWIVFINSFASEGAIMQNGFTLIPSEFSIDAYKFILRGAQVWRSYGITIFVTVVGTALAVMVSTMLAYLIASPKVKYRNVIGFMTYFTMIFGSGLVGFYIMIASWLNLKDNILAMILPYVVNPFYVFILVSFFRDLPQELSESAMIDGANDMITFFKIALPVSKPVIATVSLFYALVYWNDWWLALLFIDDYQKQPLQMMIRKLMANVNMAQYVGGTTNYGAVIPTMGIQLAIVCITIGPIILLYPFVQKYFVKGIMIGSVKG